MKTIYRADDGQEFDTLEECVKHEALVKTGNEKRARQNLQVYLANKSRLKAGILRRDTERLNQSWKEWQDVMARCKDKLRFHDSKLCQAIYDALFHLERDSGKYWLDQMYLSEATMMIKRLNDTIRKIDEAKKNGTEYKLDEMYNGDVLREAHNVKNW